MAESLTAPVDLEPVYWTPGEVAALLKVHKKTIYRLAADDPTFPCLRLGNGKPNARGRAVTGTLRIPRARLLTWLRNREQGLGRANQHTDQRIGPPVSSRRLARRTLTGAEATVPVTDASARGSW